MSSLEVLRAILNDDVEKVDEFVRQGFDVNENSASDCWNYLHRSLISIAKPPTARMVQHLIDCGANVNANDLYGNNSLNYAVKLKNSDIVKVLLDANVDVNNVNEDGVSPLRESLLTKSLDYASIKLLLESGADAEQKIKGGVSVKELAQLVASEDALLMSLFI